jgi:hypothetical protein
MTAFKGGDAIRAFLEEVDNWLSESVTVYLVGGSAMTVQGVSYPRLKSWAFAWTPVLTVAGG